MARSRTGDGKAAERNKGLVNMLSIWDYAPGTTESHEGFKQKTT